MSYEQIAKEGGGILSTVAATRAASAKALFESAGTRLQTLAADGVATVEIKSGYGLDVETEIKMLEVARQLQLDGSRVRVVSMPCTEAFDAQPDGYREHVLPDTDARRLAIEAGTTHGWWRYIAGKGNVLGIDRFGESAPAAELFEKFGFTVEAISTEARRLLS